ncbi:MAG TPA: hypothetical protein DEB39_10690 [Planctomycetaceae bacterium]|nr:hypothetical protein [Planctomycetaceae bacterium]
MKYKQTLWMICLILVSLLGCRKGPDTQFIEGVVKLDGVPLEKATVTFAPKSTDYDPETLERPLLASGVTDEKGYYRLSSVGGGQIGGGTTVGSYVVLIVKKEQTNTPPPAKPGEPSISVRPEYKYHTPKKFETRDTSGIEVDVVKGRNHFQFDLQSDGGFEIEK